MLTRVRPLSVALTVLLAGGCGPEIFDESCYVRSFREVDWDFVRDEVGFSANDVIESFPEAVYYKVNPGPGLALPFGQRGADWSLRVQPIHSEKPVLRRMYEPTRVMTRNCVYTPVVPTGLWHYHIPVRLQWERLDGGWSFDITGFIGTSQLFSDAVFHPGHSLSINTDLEANGVEPAEVPPEALEAATQELIDEGAGQEHFPVEGLGVAQAWSVSRVRTQFYTMDGYRFNRLYWFFELHATVPPEDWP